MNKQSVEKQQLEPLWSGFKYFNHQPPAIEWMLKQEATGATIRGVPVFGGVLGDEMGLGKTIEVAGLIKNSSERCTLVLAPLAVVATWASVLERAGMTVWTIRQNDWLPVGHVSAGKQCYITNLDKLLHRAELFDRDWDRIIIDEAHKIRNPGSEIAKACYKLRGLRRWALTATPIVNEMCDVLSLYAFLKVPVSRPLKWRPHMHKWTQQLVFHRSLEELRLTLPEAPFQPIIHKMVCPFVTAEEEEFYYGIQGSIESKLESFSRDINKNAAIFKLLLRLRQISVHPQVYIEALRREEAAEGFIYPRADWTGPATKFEAVRGLLKDSGHTRCGASAMDDTFKESGGHKTIIICHFREEIELMADFIRDNELATEVFTYSGAETIREREETVAAATAGGAGTVIILQLQAGGVGINLQTFDRVIFLTPWWNAAMVDQAVGRAVRMGQKATVQVYHIMFEAEEKMSGIMIDRFMADKVEAKRSMLLNFWAGEETAKVKAKPLRPKKQAEEQQAVDQDPIPCA